MKPNASGLYSICVRSTKPGSENEPQPNEDQALACDLTAIPSDVREEHVIMAPQLFALAQEVQELPNGFAIRFLNEAGQV